MQLLCFLFSLVTASEKNQEILQKNYFDMHWKYASKMQIHAYPKYGCSFFS